ncbi:hypothetical protein J1N35_041493 [Gossypium stocksii]|uniref:CCHC-type domain-containing protein n=1 Tax=Gossypium stocksii TaxID=47602 RepID=A0A9D3UFR3_9ROSI|nr:hypothetical protein J1N35_041493 [Gossypium stocksii]
MVKLLGRNIGYTILFNKPWTKFFNPNKPYLDVVLAWIKMSVYPGFMCKKRILEAMGGLVGKVAKLNFNTNNKTRGHFARMVVFVDLDRLLVSQVLVNGELIRVEYEALPTICFSCRKYGHLKETCPSLMAEMSLKTGITGDNLKPSNQTIGESEGMVMALDGNVFGSRKYSVIIFKENSNPNKGQILGNGENDSIEKEFLHPKVEAIGFSGDRKKRKKLWESLTSIIPNDITLWIVIGFRGPPFTWHQGELYERLERAIVMMLS